MVDRSAQEAHALVLLLLARIAAGELLGVHPGVTPHLKAAETQLVAVCALLGLPDR